MQQVIFSVLKPTILKSIVLQSVILPFITATWLSGTVEVYACQETEYSLSIDSQVQADVPHGEVKGPFEFRSDVYPGTVRNYWVYVPADYDANKKHCLLVVQDGIGRANEWKLPTVMDNLIHKKEMPATIGLFVDHGIVPAANENAQPRFNRSFEYDAMGDRYARFLVEEMLPELRKNYSFSDDPNDRAIAGASSGGICAFNVAWERPDEFRRVICTIGTFVGLRGGDEFSTLVRKTEAKPIRVFLQDGSSDLDIYAGGWWTANQGMLAALEWAGYDVKHAWGDGGHNGKHGASVMPEALRWLWRDYPGPIDVPTDEAAGRRLAVLVPGEGWVEEDALAGANGIESNDDGGVVSVNEGPLNRMLQIPVATDALCLQWDPDGTISVTMGQQENKIELAEVGGLAISPDHSWVWVSDPSSRFITNFLLRDGQLLYGQHYGDLHLSHGNNKSGAGPMLTDTTGNLLVATDLGIQVLDPLGRVNLIVRSPGSSRITDMCWGGKERNLLFVLSEGKVFRRKMLLQGTDLQKAAVKPPKPGL